MPQPSCRVKARRDRQRMRMGAVRLNGFSGGGAVLDEPRPRSLFRRCEAVVHGYLTNGMRLALLYDFGYAARELFVAEGEAGRSEHVEDDVGMRRAGNDAQVVDG